MVAHNFNGEGTYSSVYEFYSCVLPSLFDAPTRVTSTSSTLEIEWAPPEETGGCTITGYAVFIDDGTGSNNFEEANSANDLSIRNQPGLNRATITTFDAADVGQEFVVYLTTYTEAGDSTDSEHATIVLGDVPS